MFENILNRLESIDNGYSAAIDVADGIFNSVKKREFKELPNLTKFQTELLVALKSEKDKLRTEIEKIIMQKGLVGHRLQVILPLFPQTQKEIILDLVKSLSRKEMDLEKSLFSNQQYLEALVSTQQAMVDSAITISNQDNQSNQFFLNKKF